MSSLLTIRTEVRERIGEDVGDFWDDAVVDGYINDGLRQFSNEQRWSWLQTLVTNLAITSGTADYKLQPDVAINRHFAFRLLATDGVTFYFPTKVAPGRGFYLEGRQVQTGIPSWYFLVSQALNTGVIEPTIRLVPKPSANFTGQYIYFRRPAVLSADADEPDIPEDYVRAITAWATAMCWLKELNGGAKAQEQFNLYNAVLAQADMDQKSIEDSGVLAWGGEQPQLGAASLEDWARRLPPLLG